MAGKKKTEATKDDDLVFVALGGAGEIGMNMYLYGAGRGAKRRWIMVDCGVSFGDMETSPGIEIIMPDPAFIAEQADKLEGIFITHAHEDHVGALGRLWPRLKAPIYAQPFTSEIIRRKFEEVSLSQKPIKTVTGGTVAAGPFQVRFQAVTHSIPEAASLIIDTPSGRVVHTGDFKVDHTPQMGEPFDLDAFRRLGDEGVHAMVCDSTNVFAPGRGGSEADVLEPIAEILRENEGAVAATTFASNVERLRTIAVLARDAGRKTVLVGRAMNRMIETAIETGLLTDFPHTLTEDEAADLPRREVLYLVTGSQGEGRAALARIASGTHPTVSLRAGDAVIFSSKTIPGNESSVYRIYNMLAEQGVRIYDEENGRVHVSGHARREDLKVMYDALRPRISIPMHGEHRHLVEHAAFAESLQVASIAAPNGTMVALAGDRPRIVDQVPTGKLYLDGSVIIGATDGVVRERLKMARQGHVAVSLVLDEKGQLLADPEIAVSGAPETAEGWPAPLEDLIYEAVDKAVDSAPANRRSDEQIEELATRAARRACMRWWGKKPVVSVMISRLED
ncbi:ribonuclease J [Oceanicella actignis]|uniref:ribonuclease J n=1 Tax=Oceanicella actignis TaxID=1189325 RepID=UPI0011E6BC71|nr:ribonuclease J [Oceanicella actignis]TYO90065.1 ribonuclease J [Oceanicella actignis]